MDLREELKLFDQGYTVIAGVDEAGRGPLAGPVVAACVTVESDAVKELQASPFLQKRIKDSKKMDEKKREALYDIIIDEFSGVGIGICDHETIDRINILQASFLAMKKAIGSLKAKPNFILVDGKFPIPNFSTPQAAFIGGDASVFLIAAASIIAKTTRDRIMREMESRYPGYGFGKHKGYGTKSHMGMLKELGPCPIHRVSFAPVRKCLSK